MFKVHDRVKETTTSISTGDIALLGPVVQFQSFSNAFVVGETFYYGIVSQGGTQWEIGSGYLSNSTTLVRMAVFESSNSNAAVDFIAGVKEVFCTLPANVINKYNSSGQMYQIAIGNAMP